jgi:hypothetical protein
MIKTISSGLKHSQKVVYVYTKHSYDKWQCQTYKILINCLVFLPGVPNNSCRADESLNLCGKEEEWHKPYNIRILVSYWDWNIVMCYKNCVELK